jgi:phosphatidate phosphatase PAH1
LEDKEQILNAKFSYGPLEFVLAGEKVDIYISNQGGQKQGDYQFYASELTDNHGKIKYQIPTKKLLPLGIYHVKMIVKCDHTYVEFYMAVLPIGTEAVVFSIDGSFAANLSLSGTDPKVRAGAVDVVRHWQDLGYLIIYITARPDMQHYKVTNWLSQHNFPLGMVFFSDGLRHDPIKQKAETLKNLVVNNNLSLQAAYGSAKDIQMYSNLGVNANRIFITGKTKTKYLNQAVVS